MDYRRLGASGLKVSSLCLGAMTFGDASGTFMERSTCDEDTAFALMDRARESGVNFIDTADVYGKGTSERVVGRWLRERGCRDETVIATKFRFFMGDGPNDKGASRAYIMRAVEASLRRLGVDCIDLYQVHMQDNDTPEQETLRALDDLVRQGKVRHIGCSNYAAYRLMDSLWRSETGGLEGFVTLQAQYNLLSRSLEREHVPLCRDKGLGVLPWSPLAAGFLTGKFTPDAPPPGDARLGRRPAAYGRMATERNFAILERVRAVAEELDASCAQVALAWLLARPQVCSVIIGARTLAQLEDNLAAAECQLPAAARRQLDDVSALDLDHPYDFIEQILGRW